MIPTAKRKPQGLRGCLPLLLVGMLFLLGPARVAANNEVDPWVYYYLSQDHFYNLEYEEAIESLQKALEGDPDNPFFHNSLANTYLFQELYRLGQLEGNLYGASNAFLKEKKPKPDPAQMAKFKQSIAKVKSLCKAQLKENPRDVDALYNLGISYATEGNYKFTIERSWFDALRAGGKANDYHKKVLRLAPDYYDAKLVPGVYEYVVGSIPRSVKWLAFLFGYSGSKQRGIRLIQEAMTRGKLLTSASAFLLAVVYNREKRYDYARTVFASLQEFYPRNPLIPLEIARTYTREGQDQTALEHYVAVAEAMEAGRPGYDKLPRERLWYQIGVLRQKQGQWDQALEAFARVTDSADGDGLLKAHSGLRRGEIFLAQSRPEQARAEYRRVADLPYEETRQQAHERLRKLGP